MVYSASRTSLGKRKVFVQMAHVTFIILCRQELLDMNRAPPNKTLKEATELKEHIEKFHEWKYEREQRIA